MKYSKLQQAANNMSDQEMTDSLRSLLADSRFPAMVKLLTSHKEQFVEAMSQQPLAHHHGALAHAGGSIHALRTFEGVLKELAEPPIKRGMKKAEG